MRYRTVQFSEFELFFGGGREHEEIEETPKQKPQAKIFAPIVKSRDLEIPPTEELNDPTSETNRVDFSVFLCYTFQNIFS